MSVCFVSTSLWLKLEILEMFITLGATYVSPLLKQYVPISST